MSDIPQAIAAVEAALAAYREARNALPGKPWGESIRLFAVMKEAAHQLASKVDNHAPALIAAARESLEKDAEIERLRAAMCDAMTDIQQWMQLARRQREEMPNVNHCPYGPNEAGIEASDRVLGKCRAALSGRPPSE